MSESYSNEQTYSLSSLKENCLALFGVTSSTFAGATNGLTGGEYSTAEIRRRIDEWLMAPVSGGD